MTRRIRVAVPGDPDIEPADLDLAAPTAPTVVLSPKGRATVTSKGDGDAADHTSGLIAPLRSAGTGPILVEVVVEGWRFELEVEDADRAAIRRRATRIADAAGSSGPVDIRAIIPGRIAAVRVTVGDEVELGQTLLVVEAMKMQNELRAPRPGRVERVLVGEGQTIDRGDLLVVIA